jgi:Fe-S-cluster-containing hydrogenase component 2
LERRGVRALAPPMGFPMEMDRFPGRIWTLQHKTVAEAAGLGVMGIHRSIIHPEFGSFILLGTVVLAVELEAPAPRELASPCFECKLCVAACPVGAIRPDGYFDFSACYTHNYREFMGGFTDWVEQVAEAKDAKGYRDRVSDSESVSMWQSLSYGANYKAAYCMAACPAGEDVIDAYEADKPEFLRTVLKPLQAKEEQLYVMPGSDAEAYAHKRFPHKPTRSVGNTLRPVDLDSFLRGATHVFQRDASEGLDAVYHFRFSGDEEREATITIRDRTIRVQRGLVGEADLVVRADTRTWVSFLRKELSIVRALLTLKVRLRGPARLLVAFGKCFP